MRSRSAHGPGTSISPWATSSLRSRVPPPIALGLPGAQLPPEELLETRLEESHRDRGCTEGVQATDPARHPGRRHRAIIRNLLETAADMRITLAALVLTSILVPAAPAQNCGAGNILLKNDILPDLPSGSTTVGIVPGLCDGEAAMSVFQTGGPASVNSVAVMFGAAAGTNGVQAVVDLEIYDGITAAAGGRWVLGPRVFRLSDLGSNLQIQSHGINTYTLPSPVRCTSGQCVVGWRMVLNTASGSCALGYTANFCLS